MIHSAALLTRSETNSKPRGHAARRNARVLALQSLYEVSSVGHDADEALDSRFQECTQAVAASFCRTLVQGVLANSEEIDKIISAFAPNWPLAQMALVDRNILRIAIYEIIMGHETPPKVAINEAVELAKVFGSDSSPKFVNGVLGSVMESLKQETKS